MPVQLKILAACLGFVAIIAALGGLAQRQAAEMGRLAVGIYDHSFMGMSYVDQAQTEFLRLAAAHSAADASLADAAGRADVQKVLDRLDVALERASSERTQSAGQQARAAIAALPQATVGELPAQLAGADRAINKLVKKFGADGLDSRDEADALAEHSARLVLIEIGAAIVLALGVGLLVGRSLSRPLVQLVRVIDALASGNVQQPVPPKLLRRRDEIGQAARAAAVFREAMQQNARVSEEREQINALNEAQTVAALREAAESIERETIVVTQRSAESSAVLAKRAEALAQSAARMLTSVGTVTEASETALRRSELVAAAGEQLSASASEIASQITGTASEIANTARAGERARQMIDQLSTAVGQIGAVARLIGDIAGRTNLLALNATIEAARAGDAGRGFAVVASEVKSLASQTANSTQEIARNAAAIQQATQDAVDVVGEMIGRVAAIERITHSVAAAAEQQTAATGEIARNVAGSADAMRVVAGQIGAVSAEARGTDAAVQDMRDLAGDVGERIAELRGVMVRIVRTSSTAADRRQAARYTIDGPATLQVNGRSLPATCIDLGLGGAHVRVTEAVPVECRVALHLPKLPVLAGVVRVGGEDVRIRFDWDANAAPAELRAYLGRQQAA